MTETQSFRVFSEIGRLRRVLVHRPGGEIDQMMPDMMERLLFDDILDGHKARREHGRFRRVLEAAGVEVVDPGELLADVLEENDSVREYVLDALEKHGFTRSRVEELAARGPRNLAELLIAGVRAAPSRGGRLFDLLPVPNYFFQRDPLIVLGDRVVLSAMATDARAREPLLSRLVFENHSRVAGYRELYDLRPSVIPESHELAPPVEVPALEGGDVLVAREDLVLVGLSERTNRRGVEALASFLAERETTFREMLVIELPRRRSYMHLDTVFTFIDHGLCLGHAPLILPGGSEFAYAYSVDLSGSGPLNYRKVPVMLDWLRERGLDVELVPCGGEDIVDQYREQWTDGANAFALAPGVILLYERNRRTVEALQARDWRILSSQEVLDGAEVLGSGPTAITLESPELSRARGGPRCMTMPLYRDPLG